MLNGKIILTGPENSGKSTLKLVIFERKNPQRLLDHSLKATKGICSSAFSFFEKFQFGIHDLAGQENEYWFSSEGDQVFIHSNIIICIFDNTSKVIEIQNYIEKVIDLKKDLGIKNCKIIIFLHKIDQEKPSFITYRLKVLRQFVSELDEDILIYPTSITKKHFFKTFYTILEILISIFEDDMKIPIEDSRDLSDLELELEIIEKYELKVNEKVFKNKVSDLMKVFNISNKKAIYHLERLQYFGLINISKDLSHFMLNERAMFFKEGFKKYKKSYKKRSLDILYYFLNLSKISIN